MVNQKIKKLKSPLNYIGGKYKLLDQILPLFPTNIHQFVDLFAGGCNISINVEAQKIYCNDILIYIIKLFQALQKNKLEDTLQYINDTIRKYQLSLTNKEAYLAFRNKYNQEQQALDLFILIAYSFNHQIRFNNSHQYNNPFGYKRSSFNPKMKANLCNFINRIQEKDIIFSSKCFSEFDFSMLTQNDFVYCDPPYLITTGTYNDGKRGFKGWSKTEECLLLKKLDELNDKNIRFGLSNVLEHKGRKNDILIDWLDKNNYKINYITANYANSNYQIKNKKKQKSIEVLITNYKPTKKHKEMLTLF